jgi:hypothetical protein
LAGKVPRIDLALEKAGKALAIPRRNTKVMDEDTSEKVGEDNNNKEKRMEKMAMQST